jgi:predicted GNAT family N-acyltransferase
METTQSKNSVNVTAGLVTTPEEREAVFALRMVVFVEEQQVPPEEELDAYDVTATHFLARTETGEIIGTARLVDKSEGVGKVGRVAVRQDWRGYGIGALLMREVERHAREVGFQKLALDAQCYAIPFYEKLGYTAEGDIFLDAGIEHRFMSKACNPDTESTQQ